jgi:plastocyanin
MTRRTLPALTAAAVLAVVAAQPAEAATKRLNATVGPGFTITLKNVAGKKVTTLRRGTYTLVVMDRSRSHNFHLRGPGINRRFTSVGFLGKRTFTVTLKRGTYRFVCDPHASGMHGSFRVV